MLIYGERRTEALRLSNIIESKFKLFENLTEKEKIKMFYDENEERKDYTPAEREERLRKIDVSGVYKNHKEMANNLNISLSRLEHLLGNVAEREKLKKTVVGDSQIDEISSGVIQDIKSLPIKEKTEIIKDIIEGKQPTSTQAIRKRVKEEKQETKIKQQIQQNNLDSENAERLRGLHELIRQRKEEIIPELESLLLFRKTKYNTLAESIYELYKDEIDFPNNEPHVISTTLSLYNDKKIYSEEEIILKKLKTEKKTHENTIKNIDEKITKIFEKMSTENRERERYLNELSIIDERIVDIQNAIKREQNNIIQYKKEIDKL